MEMDTCVEISAACLAGRETDLPRAAERQLICLGAKEGGGGARVSHLSGYVSKASLPDSAPGSGLPSSLGSTCLWERGLEGPMGGVDAGGWEVREAAAEGRGG